MSADTASSSVDPGKSSTDAPVIADENHELVRGVANDYAEYMNLRVHEEARMLDDSIDELLTKLEEYCGLVDIVRSDTTLCLKRTLPEIQAKSQAMTGVFERIDQMEAFVAMVKTHVATMEALLDQAESEMGTSGVMKLLSSLSVPSLFGQRKQTPPKSQRSLSKFTPPEVFRTEDYFPSSERDIASPAAEATESSVNIAAASGDNQPEPSKEVAASEKEKETAMAQSKDAPET